MNQVYTLEQLLAFNRPQLWQLCRERGLKCYPKSVDCVEAIWNKQQSVEKVAVAEIKVDPEAVAQTELETQITDRAETVAPEITTVEISFFDHEVYALGKQIASITYSMDDFATQRWVVMVGETEIHRADAWAKCHSYIAWHYKQGTLPTALRVETISPEIEIDSDCDPDFGVLYRVWGGSIGIKMLGTFYHAAADEKWVAQPTHSSERPRCNTAAEAQLFIVGQHSEKTNLDRLLDKPFDELTVPEWELVAQNNADLSRQLELAYTSSNFGCYNRAGAEVRGNEFIQKERRRIASGELVMVCCDIAGMGRRNSEIGERSVNNAIATSLKEIQSWRGVHFLSQLNSGDEFVFVVDRVDAAGIVPRMDALFKSAGFEGIYGAVEPINDDYIKSANDGMELVYKLKQFAHIL